MPFSVAFVCTGNVCRSPVAERLLTSRIGAQAEVVVWSAGTHALSGLGIDAPSAAALVEFGVSPAGHVAHVLNVDSAEATDLILCATTAHRRFILERAPRLLARTFTLLEFGRLARTLDSPTAALAEPAELRAAVAAIARQRGQAATVPAPDDDIADPYGAGHEVARACVHQISRAVDAAIAALAIGRA